MKIKNIIMAAAALLVAAQSFGQSRGDIAGRLMGQSYFDITDMLNLSQSNYTLGTARSAAMGGAFTSLGADLSSLNINPAGLGMYQSNDFGVTASIQNNKTSIMAIGAPVYSGKCSQTPFKLNNFGFAFNVWEGSGALTNINMGITYNSKASFNSTASYEVRNQPFSIADVFMEQLIDMSDLDGISQNMMNSSSEPFNNPEIMMSEWGSVLAYQTEVVYGESDGSYSLHRSLSQDAKTNGLLKTQTRGSSGDFDISVGGNIKSILYFGASIGISQIDYSESNLYEEAYTNNTVEYPIQFMMYDQYVKTKGAGINGKFGLTVRPVGGLRIGVAFHTPTYVSLTKQYGAAMRARFTEIDGYNDVTKESATNSYSYTYTTPARLMTGLSYTFGNWAVISADYECAWYNSMRLKEVSDYVATSYKAQIKEHYKAAHNFRVGLEIKPTSFLALRGGFGYQGNALRDGVNSSNKAISGELAMFNRYDNPVVYKTLSGGAGIGLRFKSLYLDFAYTFNRLFYSPFMWYYFQRDNELPISQVGYTGANGTDEVLLSYKQSVDRHGFMVTVGFRF